MGEDKMAAHSEHAKKLSSKADRQPAGGMTGMGSSTQAHFVEVQKKMDDYFQGKPPVLSSARKDRNTLQVPNNHQKGRHAPGCPGNHCGKKAPVVPLWPLQEALLAHLNLASPRVNRRH